MKASSVGPNTYGKQTLVVAVAANAQAPKMLEQSSDYI